MHTKIVPDIEKNNNIVQSFFKSSSIFHILMMEVM